MVGVGCYEKRLILPLAYHPVILAKEAVSKLKETTIFCIFGGSKHLVYSKQMPSRAFKRKKFLAHFLSLSFDTASFARMTSLTGYELASKFSNLFIFRRQADYFGVAVSRRIFSRYSK